MMHAIVIPELSLLGVEKAGVPDEERIVMRPTQDVELGGFGVAAGILDPATGSAAPIFDNAFWFPQHLVSPPSWIVIFTGKGSPRQVVLDDQSLAHVFFWHRAYTVFETDGIVPILFQVGSAVVGKKF